MHSRKYWYAAVFFAAVFWGFVCVCAQDDSRYDADYADDLAFGIPLDSDQMLVRKGFAIGYSNKDRQAIWVCYILSAKHLEGTQVKRCNKFKPDPLVPNPVTPEDYNRTGYDRGHLAPAADMTYSEETMTNSFFMTNISPQVPGCNRGIWKRLEQQVRNWARKEKMICVITGPVFSESDKSIPETGIRIPCAFYKVILDMTRPRKMIGFIVPNQTTKKRIPSFVVTVDDVEKVTGCDFFSSLPDKQERKLESTVNPADWNL